jgi:hypothetical protein
VNSALYCEVLLKLQDAICRNPGQLVRRVLHHDNARPHTARATQERIQELQCKLLEHPESPDLAHSDFHLFGLLKTTFMTAADADNDEDEEIEMEVRKWLRQYSKDFYAASFDTLVKRWSKCITVGGGYIEK